MSQTSASRLTPADLDRLEALLAADHLMDSMTLDALQGLFCAVASAPSPIPREEWLEAALGEHAFASEAEAGEVTDLLTRFYGDTARDIAAEEGLDVLSYPVEEGEEELAVWCEGYLVGVALAEPDWFSAGDGETVDELLFPFMALSGRLKEHALESGAPWERGEAEAKLMNDARESFYATVEEAYQYWFDNRINRVPQKREGDKIGRNDPCPCGSGKKYKACHGAG